MPNHTIFPILLCCSLTLAAGLGGCAEADRSDRPNVIVITLDTTRADHIGCYGHKRPTTPHLDALAADAVRYDTAYAVSSWTLPSHASLFTGKFPSAHGARYDSEGPISLVQKGGIKGPETWGRYRARPMSDQEITLAQVLGEYGWETGGVIAGPWLKRVFGLSKGFDFWDDSNFQDLGARGELNGRPAVDVTRVAIEFIEEHKDEPFFLFLNYYDAHGPRIVDDEFRNKFWPGPDPAKATPVFLLSLYDAEINYADHHFGVLIEHLKQNELYEDCWIVVLSDHGELMGDNGLWGHGDCLSEAEIRMPLIIKEPGPDRPRGVDSTPVQQIDIMPLLLSRLKLPLPPNMQGSPRLGRDHPMIAEVNPLPLPGNPQRDWRQMGDWRVVLDGPWKFVWGSRGRHALYNLETDPGETTNLLEQEGDRVGRMQQQLEDYMAALPAPGELGEIGEIDPETLRLLESLGYIGGKKDD